MDGFLDAVRHKAAWVLKGGAVAAMALMLLISLPMTVLADDEERIDTIVEDKKTFLGTPYHAWWEGESIARWSSVKKAYRYQVQLYENDESVVRVTVADLSYDFAQYIKEGNRYYFEVRAVLKTYAQRYVDSENNGWKQSEDMVGVNQGEVDGHWRHYQAGDKYQKKDQSFATAGWLKIVGKWYYFDENGYLVKGQWIDDSDRRYYVQEDGSMATGWILHGSDWYYLGEDGSMQTGWIQITPGERYYLYPDGRMAASTQIDGFTIDENGLCRG